MLDSFFGLDKPPAMALRTSGTAKPSPWFVEAVCGEPTLSGSAVSEKTALSCAAVKAAVGIRASTIANLPLRVYEDLGDGAKRLARGHWADELLSRRPNSETSRFNWMETLQTNADLWGNAYAEIEWGMTGQALGLWQRSSEPYRTQPVRLRDNSLSYECHDEWGGVEPNIPPANMIHLAGVGFDGIAGRSPIQDARETIGVAKAREKYAAQFFGRDCRPGGVITVPGSLSEPAYNRTKLAFNQNDERHRIQLLEEGATFAATQMNPSDVQLVEEHRLSVEDVARIYGVPLPLLQLYMQGMAYASVIELNQAFITYTIQPVAKRWEDSINPKMFPEGGFFCEFNYREFLKGNIKDRNESYRTQFSFGGLTINDFLRKENENPIGSEGDRRFVPLNMIPLDRFDEYVDALIEGRRGGRNSNPSGTGRRALSAVLRVYGDTVARMLSRMGEAAKRAAKHPESFLDKIEAQFAKDRAFILDALAPAVEAVLCHGRAVCGGDGPQAVSSLADTLIAESRARLLRAAECKPSELEAAVAAEVDTWATTRRTEGLSHE